MKCILCRKETSGSIGAAGIVWPMICQPCKDREDSVLAATVRATIEVFKAVDKAFE